jgi:hypothetical protein
LTILKLRLGNLLLLLVNIYVTYKQYTYSTIFHYISLLDDAGGNCAKENGGSLSDEMIETFLLLIELL